VLIFLDGPAPRAVVLSTPLWEQIKSTSNNANPAWLTCEAQGWNTAKGWDSAKGAPAFVDLTLVVKR
jgi:hypothetical protein